MFPLNWNIPFIRKNGSRTTLGAITGDIAGIEEDVTELTDKTDGLWDNMSKSGAVNLLPNNATADTINGVTFTVNSDGTVTADGTATADAGFDLYTNTDGSPYLIGKTVKLTGCPTGGSSTKYSLQVTRAETTSGSSGTPQDFGDGVTFVWLNNGSGTNAVAKIVIANGQTVSNLVFKPMISNAALDLSYADYQPYSKTNRELTEDVAVKALSFTDYFTMASGFIVSHEILRKVGNGYSIQATVQGTLVAGRNAIATMNSVLGTATQETIFGSGRVLDSSSVYHPAIVGLPIKANAELSVYTDTAVTNGYCTFSLFIPF